jgi:hypothetical protein
MRFQAVIRCTMAIGIAFCTAACVNPAATNYTGPGCLIHIYTLPNLQGYGLPIVRDTPELAAAWRNMAASARVIYGTWRLFADPDYKGFMGDYRAPADIPQLIPTHDLESLKCIVPEPAPPRY